MADLELKQWARILRGRWRVIMFFVLLGGGLGAAYAWTRTPIYQAETQMFVATVGNTSNPAQTYAGGLFAQQRVLSYATIVSSPPVLRRVIADLNLPETIQALEKEITATVPQGTVLLDITVRDKSAQRAQAIAAALDVEFPASSTVSRRRAPALSTSPTRR